MISFDSQTIQDKQDNKNSQRAFFKIKGFPYIKTKATSTPKRERHFLY
jgi:hypothetical protein